MFKRRLWNLFYIYSNKKQPCLNLRSSDMEHKKVVIYARVSSKEKERDGFSIST